jgi:hypothetical protein
MLLDAQSISLASSAFAAIPPLQASVCLEHLGAATCDGVVLRRSCQTICKEQVAVAQQSPAAAIVPDVQLHFINIIGLPVNFLPPAEAVRVEIGLDLLPAPTNTSEPAAFQLQGNVNRQWPLTSRKALAADACQCLVMLVLLIDLIIIISPGVSL